MLDEIKLPNWRARVISARKKEGQRAISKWMQLATINKNNYPEVRTVVFRGWNKSSDLIIYTDSRSQKILSMKYTPNVEICWLFAKSNIQFRFSGKAYIINDENRLKYWNNISLKSKKTWYWPSPLEKYNHKSFNINYDDKTQDLPDNFCVIYIHIEKVDELNLNVYPHTRFIWERKNDWTEIKVNP